YVSASLRTVPAARWQPGRVLLAVLAGLSGAPAGQARTAAYFAAPAGRSDGSGGADHPWDLATALGGGRGKVQPGDTIWLRGGTYAGSWVSTLTGTATAPVVVRPYAVDRATLDGRGESNDPFVVRRAWMLYWGFARADADSARHCSGTSCGF